MLIQKCSQNLIKNYHNLIKSELMGNIIFSILI